MNDHLISNLVQPILLAQDAQQQEPMWTMLVPMGIVTFAIYFIMIRPQLKAKKDHDKLLAGLKTGDRVITTGGLLGTITNVKDQNVVVMRIADNVKVEVQRSAITAVTTDEVKEETK